MGSARGRPARGRRDPSTLFLEVEMTVSDFGSAVRVRAGATATFFALTALAAASLGAADTAPPTVLVEAEMFADLGGWEVDQQSMDQMGSPYALAHGLGVPVGDATTSVSVPQPGEYRVWVRTRD
jgi:hypothetical protein